MVEAARTRIADAFDATQPHGAYAYAYVYDYGSIPRGTAIPGVSDLCLSLPPPAPTGRRRRRAAATTHAERRNLGRGTARRIVRSRFTLVMPRWGGWTSDLQECAEIFCRYYPERAEQVRTAAATGRTHSADPAVLGLLINDPAPRPSAEYVAVHGEKAPCP